MMTGIKNKWFFGFLLLTLWGFLGSCASTGKKPDDESLQGWVSSRSDKEPEPLKPSDRPSPPVQPQAPAKSLVQSASGVRLSSQVVSQFERATRVLDRSEQATPNSHIDQQRAKEILEKLILVEPRFVEALVNLGLAYERQRDFLKAEAYYRSAFQQAPGYLPACIHLGGLLSQINHVNRAVTILKTCLEKNPPQNEKLTQDQVDAHLLLAELYSRLQDYRLATIEIRQVLQLSPDDLLALAQLGSVYLKQGKFHQSKIYLEQSLAKAKRQTGNTFVEQARIVYSLALCHQGLGEEAKAIDLWKRATKLDPNYPKPFTHLGQLALKSGDAKKAQLIFHQLIQLEPRDSNHHVHLAMALRQAGQFSQAELEYYRALRINSKNSEAYFNLALLYHKYLKSPQKALLFYKRFTNLNPQLAKSREVQELIQGAQRMKQTNLNKGKKP